MSKKIFEEKGGPHRGHAAGATDVEKQASQLASDTRYKVKQSMGKGTKLNPAQVSKAYLAQLAKSPAPPAVKALAKKKLMGEEYTEDIKQLVESSLVNALVQVFTEESEEKVWIVVTDKKTGNTYRRQATRAKIAELRANPNISRVEITSYHPDEDDDKKGEKTARVKAGKGLKNDGNLANNYPPYDKVTRGDVIAGATGKDQMGGKRKVKEEFIGEVKQKTDTENKKITGEKVNNYNGKDAVIKVFPNLEEQINDNENDKITTQKTQQKFLVDPNQRKQISVLQQFQNRERQLNQQKIAAQKAGKIPVGSVQMNSHQPEGDDIQEVAPPGAKYERMVKHIKAGYADDGLTKKEKSIAYATAWKAKNKAMKEETCNCEDEKDPKLKKSEGGVEDSREIPTKVNIIKNKLRAMGLKMDYEPEGEILDERRKEDKVAGTPRKPRDRAFELVAKSMGTSRLGVKLRGVKKQKGAPTSGPSISPAQKIENRRAAAQRAQDMMHSRFD